MKSALERVALQSQKIQHTGKVFCVAFSPDENLATGGEDGTVRLWNLQNGTVRIFQIRNSPELYCDVLSIAVSPDGRFILAGTSDNLAFLYPTSNKKPWYLATSLSPKRAVAFSPDGTLFALACEMTAQRPGIIEVFETSSQKKRWQLLHLHHVTALAFDPTQKRLASGSHDKTVRIWGLVSGTQQHQLELAFIINSLAYSPDGTTLAIAGQSSGLQLRHASSYQIIRLLSVDANAIYQVKYSPNNQFIGVITSHNSLQIWETTNYTQVLEVEATTFDFSPNSKTIAISSPDRSTRILEITTAIVQQQKTLHSSYISRFAVSRDGTKVVTAGHDHTARIWDSQSQQELSILNGHTDSLYWATFSPDGQFIATASRDQTIRIWTVSTGLQHLQIEHPSSDVAQHISCLTYNSDGTTLVSSNGDLYFWNPATGKLNSQINQLVITGIAFHPNRKQFWSYSSLTGSVRCWEVGSQTPIWSANYSGRITSLGINPTGDLCALGTNNSLIICDSANGQIRQQLELQGQIIGLHFSPDAKYLAAATFDGTIQVWDTTDHKVHLRFYTPFNPDYTICFSPDATRLYAGSSDGVRIYATPEYAPVFQNPNFLEQLWDELTTDEKF